MKFDFRVIIFAAVNPLKVLRSSGTCDVSKGKIVMYFVVHMFISGFRWSFGCQ